MKRFGKAMNLRAWVAVAGVLLGAVTLSGCPGGNDGAGTEDGAPAAPDASVAKPDAATSGGGDAGTMSSKGGAGGGSQAPDGGLSSSDTGTRPPQPNQACTVAAQCASGFCVDGVCCDTACNGACEGCALTGSVGTCFAVKNGADDACMGDSTCDAAGVCKKDLGKSCSSSVRCASGNCVDGVCCATAACGTCQACAVAGFEGACAPVARFGEDESCSGACDGLGECRAKNGSACTAAGDCVSLHCVDGVCCNEACTGTCYSCNQAASPGTCLAINGAEDASATAVCQGANICAGAAGGQPVCKLKGGQTCSTSAQCASGNCATTVVPADPSDPYASGYTFTTCE